MIDLRGLTGMRPGEVVIMRPEDIDRTAMTWKYWPLSHKTEHHGTERVVFLGPKAQAVLVPFLQRDLEMFLFSPREAMAEKYRERRRNGRACVRIEKHEYARLKACFLEQACRRCAGAGAMEFEQNRFQPYAPVHDQLLGVWRAVNRTRRMAGYEPVPIECMPWKRQIVKPFDDPRQSWVIATSG